MASRYLLIEFEDEASALALREKIDSATRAGKRYRVLGLYAKPQAPYCGCGKETTSRGNESTLKRGRKFGWWVCKECKRPAASISGLVNLLTPRDIIKPTTFDTPKYKLMFHFLSLSAITHAVPEE